VSNVAASAAARIFANRWIMIPDLNDGLGCGHIHTVGIVPRMSKSIVSTVASGFASAPQSNLACGGI